MTSKQRVAAELVRIAEKISDSPKREAAGAEDGIWEAIDEISNLGKNLHSHLKSLGLRQDRMAQKAMKALGDAGSYLMELV